MAGQSKLYAAEEVVSALYEALLLRKADPEGLNASVSLLETGRWANLSDVIKNMLRSQEFTDNHTEFFNSYVKAGSARFTNDVSQYGEFGLLLRRLVNHGAERRVVVDVGARGRARSNSYDLMRQFGWRGLLVEANPNLLATISAEFAGLDVTLVHCGVSDRSGNATFYLGTNDDVSSLTEHAAKGWGPITGQVEIPVERLETILRANDIHFEFDVLSVDIEGEDIKVINDLVANSVFRPTWIIVEAQHANANTFDGVPVNDAVRDCYVVVDHTRSNLILEHRD